MLALARVCAIVYLSICIPTRWLAGNSQKLEKYNWSIQSMGKVVDILDIALDEITNDGTKFVDQDFMLGMFDELKDVFPSFNEYYQHLY